MSLSDFVGIPHADLGRDRAGCDCYGLLRLVYAEDLGIALPSFTGTYATCAEHAQIAALLTSSSAAPQQPARADLPPQWGLPLSPAESSFFLGPRFLNCKASGSAWHCALPSLVCPARGLRSSSGGASPSPL